MNVVIPVVASKVDDETVIVGPTWDRYWPAIILGSKPALWWIAIWFFAGKEEILKYPPEVVPIPVTWTVSPIAEERPTVEIVIPAPTPAPITEVSKSNCSPFVYPEPPAMISIAVIDPPAETVTFAVAPSQVAVPSLNNLTL